MNPLRMIFPGRAHLNLRPASALLAVFMIAGTVLSACGGASSQTTAAPTETETEPETERVIEVVSETVAETEPETEADLPPKEGMVRSRLTNEWIPEELDAQRPIAVMFPIDRKAQPQYGLNKVDVFYEIEEEGGMSRQMGVIQDWADLPRIGNVRSVRDYFIYEALEWDAIVVHFGGPETFVKPILTRKDVDNINGVDGVMGSSYGAFFRIPKGSKSEHTAYTSGGNVAKAIEKAGWSRTHREEYYQPEHSRFVNEKHPHSLEDYPDAVDATEINMAGSYGVTKPVLRYDPETRKYYRSIYGSAQKDGNTGDQLAFTNVFILNCDSGSRGGSLYLWFHVLDWMKEGWFITGGKMIHGHWVKNTDYEPTRFYDDNGDEVTWNTGKTMIFITQIGQDTFTVDGTKYECK